MNKEQTTMSVSADIGNEKTIPYLTRDAKGNEFTKCVDIKQYSGVEVDFYCPICGDHANIGVRVKDIVSSNFTDWQYVGDYVCGRCADLFSLYFYSYVVDPDGIHLLNVRQLREQLITPQKVPFLFVITTSQKKHLFYRSTWNYNNSLFAVNLETETIYTTPERMRILFDFVECLQSLGCTKDSLKRGEISFCAAQKVGSGGFRFLRKELTNSREIQIPLYCGQKRNISEEEAICVINSILRA